MRLRLPLKLSDCAQNESKTLKVTIALQIK